MEVSSTIRTSQLERLLFIPLESALGGAHSSRR